MNLVAAAQMAMELMKIHGLSEDWALEWDDSTSKAGAANSGLRIIKLSTFLTKKHIESEVRDTILHEIAHAIVGTHVGHQREWHKKFVEIGGSGRRCYCSVTADGSHIYTAYCKNGHLTTLMDKPKYTKSCMICKPYYDASLALNFKLIKL